MGHNIDASKKTTASFFFFFKNKNFNELNENIYKSILSKENSLEVKKKN